MSFQLDKDYRYSSQFPKASRSGVLTASPHPLWKNGPPQQIKNLGPYASNTQTYTSFSGTDITAVILMPNEPAPLILGELQTISVSIHRENTPVRLVGHVSPRGFVKGPRTIAGSLIFTNFNQYAFYRLQEMRMEIGRGLHPLSDMLPPFDIILSFQNESGAFAKMKILGVTIVDEGTTMSVDDLITESTYTYMARAFEPMTAYVPDGWEIPEYTSAETVTRPILELRG
jgi:hypothetical protein